MRRILIVIFLVSILLFPGICFAESGNILLPAFKIELPKIEISFISAISQLDVKDIIKEKPAVSMNSRIEDIARLQFRLERAV